MKFCIGMWAVVVGVILLVCSANAIGSSIAGDARALAMVPRIFLLDLLCAPLVYASIVWAYDGRFGR